jgi:hypothetical protein
MSNTRSLPSKARVWTLGFLGTAVLSGLAAAPTPSQVQFFESRVRPVLADNCYKCHSQQAEKVKGGLLLDTREGVLKGGESGPGQKPADQGGSLCRP